MMSTVAKTQNVKSQDISRIELVRTGSNIQPVMMIMGAYGRARREDSLDNGATLMLGVLLRTWARRSHTPVARQPE